MRKFFTHNFTKTVITLTAVIAGMNTAHASMPAMNATDHVYGYHLRDVYKDMEAMKNDYSNKLNTIDVSNSNITTSINGINSTIDTIKQLENDNSHRIDSLANNVQLKQDEVLNHVESNKRSIDSLESATNKLANHVDSLHSSVSNLSHDVATIKKGLAQANALSSLKYLGGKGLQISIGTGGYKGQNAIAYGVFYGINDDLMIYAGGTEDSYNGSINIRFK